MSHIITTQEIWRVGIHLKPWWGQSVLSTALITGAYMCSRGSRNPESHQKLPGRSNFERLSGFVW